MVCETGINYLSLDSEENMKPTSLVVGGQNMIKKNVFNVLNFIEYT